MLTTVDFDDELLLEADEVENEVLKRHLTAKLEGSSRRSRSSRHMAASASVGSRRIFFANLRIRLAWPMVWRLRLEPLTRRLALRGATLSHKGRGKIGAVGTHAHTRIGIST